MYHSANRTIFAIFVVALFSVTPALATSIATGVDLYAAVPGDVPSGPGSQWDFIVAPIPADFFDPGSDPFDGVVLLQGNPTGPGNTDTLMQRLAAIAPFPVGPTVTTIPIEIMELSLTSIVPITVTSGTGSELWDLDITLSGPQPTGGMDVDHTLPNGGDFDATIHIRPKFTFTRVAFPNDVRVLDTVIEGLLPFDFQTPLPMPWTHTTPPGDMHTLPLPAGDFYPGVLSPVIFNDLASGSGSRLVYNATTPEPTTLLVLALGLVPVFFGRVRRR